MDTKDPVDTRDPVIERAAAKVGGVIRLAARLNISRSAVAQWKRVPAERVLDVESITGVSRYDLRPDIYGHAPPPPPSFIRNGAR